MEQKNKKSVLRWIISAVVAISFLLTLPFVRFVPAIFPNNDVITYIWGGAVAIVLITIVYTVIK